jgi:hypothetical protein
VKPAHSGLAARTTRSASACEASAVGVICGLRPSVLSLAAAYAARYRFCGEHRACLGMERSSASTIMFGLFMGAEYAARLTVAVIRPPFPAAGNSALGY